MKKCYVSIDYSETTPISFTEIIRLAFDAKTPDDYSSYLQHVIEKAKTSTGNKLGSVNFGIHKTGCIVPFGEGSDHPYCKNFYTVMYLNLPDKVQKADE